MNTSLAFNRHLPSTMRRPSMFSAKKKQDNGDDNSTKSPKKNSRSSSLTKKKASSPSPKKLFKNKSRNEKADSNEDDNMESTNDASVDMTSKPLKNKKYFESVTSDDIDFEAALHEYADDFSLDLTEEVKNQATLIHRCEGAFRRLQMLKDSWVRITIKNLRIDDVKLQLPSIFYLGGFNLILKVTLGEAYEGWVDNARIEHIDNKRVLQFKYPLVITIPKWGFTALELPEIHETNFIEEDESDCDRRYEEDEEDSDENQNISKSKSRSKKPPSKFASPLLDHRKKSHHIANRSEKEDEGGGYVAQSGPVPTQEEDFSSLPTDDWLRCKAALKMGRSLWEAVQDVHETQIALKEQAKQERLKSQIIVDGKPMLMRRRVSSMETAEEVAMSMAAAYKDHADHMKVHAPTLGVEVAKQTSVRRKKKLKSFTAKVNPNDELNWHKLRCLPVHAEAMQSAAYQSFKECCGPLEAVFNVVINFICGRSFIPDIVRKRNRNSQSFIDSDEENDELDDEEMKRHKTFLRAKSSFADQGVEDRPHQEGKKKKVVPQGEEEEALEEGVYTGKMTAQERRILKARSRLMGQMSCDILYERLPSGADTYDGIKYSDWFKSCALHNGLPDIQLSDRDLLLELVVGFVNSQTVVMLLFYAVDIQNLGPTDSTLMILIFVTLEFLLLVASNAIQEKRARNYIFYKALRHGVLMDFENMDDAATKYCQFPFVLAGVAAVLATFLIFAEAQLSQFAKISTIFLVVLNLNNGVLRPFHELAVVEEHVLSLPKFVEVNTDHAKKSLVLLRHQDEYITLLHLRRVVQKQRWLKAHAPRRYDASKFNWDQLSVEDYQVSVTLNSDISLHHPTSHAVRGRPIPWSPPEWSIPPVASDYLPIWYEKRNGKMQLPSGMDRSFDLKFLLTFFCYSLTGGIRGWNDNAAAAAEMAEEKKMEKAYEIAQEKKAFMADTPREVSRSKSRSRALNFVNDDETINVKSNSRSRSASRGRVKFGTVPDIDYFKRGGSESVDRTGRRHTVGTGLSPGRPSLRSPNSANATMLDRRQQFGKTKSIRERSKSLKEKSKSIKETNTDALALLDLSMISPSRVGLAAYGLMKQSNSGQEMDSPTKRATSSLIVLNPSSSSPRKQSVVDAFHSNIYGNSPRSPASPALSVSSSLKDEDGVAKEENIVKALASPRGDDDDYSFSTLASGSTNQFDEGSEQGLIHHHQQHLEHLYKEKKQRESSGREEHNTGEDALHKKTLHHGQLMGSSMVDLEATVDNFAMRQRNNDRKSVLTDQEAEYRNFLSKLNADFNILSDHELDLLEEHVGEQALKEMLESAVARLELGEVEAAAELKVDLRFMHYSFWRWTSILMELDFQDPMENAAIFRLRAFRFYSTVTMIVAAVVYLNTAMIHSQAFDSAIHGHGIVEHVYPTPAPSEGAFLETVFGSG